MSSSALDSSRYNKLIIILLFSSFLTTNPVVASPAGRASVPAPLRYAPPPPQLPSSSSSSIYGPAIEPTFALPSSPPSQLYVSVPLTSEAPYPASQALKTADTTSSSSTPSSEAPYVESAPTTTAAASTAGLPIIHGTTLQNPSTSEVPYTGTGTTSADYADVSATPSSSLVSAALALVELDANTTTTTPPAWSPPSTPLPEQLLAPPPTLNTSDVASIAPLLLLPPTMATTTTTTTTTSSPSWSRPASRSILYVAHEPTISVAPDMCPQYVCRDYMNRACGRRYGGCWDACKEDRQYIDPGCVGFSSRPCRGCS